MTVTVNGLEYEIRWRHSSSGITPRTTTCVLYALDPVDDKAILAMGIAQCVATDNFCKETGRKISLTRALKNWGPFRPAERKQVWEQYFNRARGAANAQ